MLKQVWKHLESKWWQDSHFCVNYPFNSSLNDVESGWINLQNSVKFLQSKDLMFSKVGDNTVWNFARVTNLTSVCILLTVRSYKWLFCCELCSSFQKYRMQPNCLKPPTVLYCNTTASHSFEKHRILLDAYFVRCY